jgi:hypothetical protein
MKRGPCPAFRAAAVRSPNYRADDPEPLAEPKLHRLVGSSALKGALGMAEVELPFQS